MAGHSRPSVLSSFVLGLPTCSSPLRRWFGGFRLPRPDPFSTTIWFQVPVSKARLHLYLSSSLPIFNSQPGFCSPFTTPFPQMPQH